MEVGDAGTIARLTRVAAELELLFQDSPWRRGDDLVFAHPETGKPIDRSKLLKRVKAALRRADVRAVRFLDLSVTALRRGMRGRRISAPSIASACDWT